MSTFTYARAGETFTVSPAGIRLVDADGAVTIDRRIALPADVIASTVVELCFAGWTVVEAAEG